MFASWAMPSEHGSDRDVHPGKRLSSYRHPWDENPRLLNMYLLLSVFAIIHLRILNVYLLLSVSAIIHLRCWTLFVASLRQAAFKRFIGANLDHAADGKHSSSRIPDHHADGKRRDITSRNLPRLMR